MDHKQAVELQLAVKYVLGELPPVQRDEYEDHYIDCPECAKDVYAAAAFTDTAREVFRQEAQSEVPAPVRERGQSRWFAWLRPVVVAPAFAVLLIAVIYQNTITIPRFKEATTQATALVLVKPPVALRGGARRGGEEVKVAIHPGDSFGLEFDFTPTQTFDQYECQLQDESGRVVRRLTLAGTSTNREVQLAFSGGLVHAGKYNLVFLGAPNGKEKSPAVEVLRLGFSVEFLR